jgi:hypothetical protein
MSVVLRVWKALNVSKESLHTNWTIWDRGDEMWELKGDVLRHFEILERSNNNNVITERLRPLRESAIPLEAIRHSIQGWEIEDSIEGVNSVKPLHQLPSTKPSPRVKPVLPLTSSQPSIPTPSLRINDPLKAVLQPDLKRSPVAFLARSQQQQSQQKQKQNVCNIVVEANIDEVTVPEVTVPEVTVSDVTVPETISDMKLPSQPPLEGIYHHEKPSQEAQAMLEEDSSQHFYNHPMELWSSLSQWIPHHALFQPSLHHQATLELSDTPAQTYPYQIDSSKNSRTVQGQHQHVRHSQQSRPYRPKPFSREIEIPKRPLFV